MAKEPAVADAPATIICDGTYWRNAWKYQARTYRHFGWDNGTLLANSPSHLVQHPGTSCARTSARTLSPGMNRFGCCAQ